jgi:hypothetical protein
MHFENWFIKDEKALHESSYVNDLLNRSSEIEKYSIRIDELHWSTIWWIVWQFWIWKSTLINNVKNHRNNEKHSEKRFEFDARKYPDRKDLWEWFVLDFARQVDEKTFKKARKIIDWKQNEDKEYLAKTIWDALSNFPILWWIIPWWSAVSNLSYFFKSSPAKRVFEIQEIFQDLIKKIKEEKIIIVIEDIDRSWDAGIFFLETLKQFISKNDFGKEILIIMPLWTDEYYNHLDSYLKPIDYFDFFNPWAPTLDKFVKEIFVDEIINDKRYFQPLQEFLEWLFTYYPKEINLRKLKLIVRKANQNHLMMIWKYDDLFELDWRVNIIFETMKYIWFDEKNNSMFEQLMTKSEDPNNRKLLDRSSIIWAYVYNLVWCTKWWANYLYNWKLNSLYWEKIDKYSWEYKKILKTFDKLNITFYKNTDDGQKKEIVWCLYDRSNFEDVLKYVTLPLAYFGY